MATIVRTFDRTADVPKLVGYNSRGVEFRWGLFERAIGDIPRGARVLDFGAGSLRESHEFVSRGYSVTSIDLDEATLRAYLADYSWPGGPPEILSGPDAIDRAQGPFALILLFDVIEHLPDPERLLAKLAALLGPGGKIFCSVPNRYSLWEIAARINWRTALAVGRPIRPGEPHIQFKSGREWRRFFEDAGFRVTDHEMAIGFFVNSASAIVDVPLRLAGRIARGLARGRTFPQTLTDTAAGRKIMRGLHGLDQRTPALRPLYGSNLFVLERAATSAASADTCAGELAEKTIAASA